MRTGSIPVPLVEVKLQVVCGFADVERANLASKLLVRPGSTRLSAVAVASPEVVCLPDKVFADPRTMRLFWKRTEARKRDMAGISMRGRACGRMGT